MSRPSLVRLQQIKRRNGSIIYYIVLSRKLVEELGWEKGDGLVVETTVLDVNVKTKREWLGILVYREKDRERILEST